MPDHFSKNLEQRVFGAEKPPEINAVYRRESPVENQIAECLQLTETEFLRRLANTDYKSAEYLKGETLICLLGVARTENLSRITDSIALKLTKIADKIVRNLLSGKDYNENFIEESAAAVVFDMLNQILGRKEVSYDFWEVNFFVSLERLTRAHLRKHAEKSRITDNFSTLSSSENEDAFESNLPKFESLTIEKKLEIKEILAKMTAENRMIFIRYHVDDWTQEQIAEVLGITSRTVRTRLRQIEEFLQDFREAKND